MTMTFLDEQKDAITLEDVGLRYRIYNERVSTLKEAFINYLNRRNDYTDLWALRGVSLRVPTGEVIGIIGRNGSGKSTMLKIISGILRPTEGRCTVSGKVTAMIELGAGFSPELTGRENLYLNGALFGFSKAEMTKRYGRIVEFAELDGFMDTPIKNYSSGMYARLGFSIAMEVDPDILLVDEILAVGDEGFQRKCLKRFDEFRHRGMTIVIVSHDMGAIERMCDRAYLLDNGRIAAEGPPTATIDTYRAMLAEPG